METLSFNCVPLSLRRNRVSTEIRVFKIGPFMCVPLNRPRIVEHKDSRNQAIALPRLRKAKKHNNTSSDVLCLLDSLGFTVTPDIYACLIDECTRKGDGFRASEVWAHMNRNKRMVRFLWKQKGLVLVSRVLIMFMSCGCIEDARQVFDKMPTRDTAVWCVMIAGLVDNSLHFEALNLFSQLMFQPLNHGNDGVIQILFACVLKACVSDMKMDLGRTLHGWAIKLGYTRNLHVCTAFLDFYAKFRCTRETNLLFHDHIQENTHCGGGDTVFWTGALVSNCHENRFEDTIDIFRDMGSAGIRKNEFTFSSVLRACGRLKDEGCCGQQAHADAIKHGLVDSHVFVQCSLVDMYSKCRRLADARKVFDTISCQIRSQSTPCWNAMINGCLKNGAYVEAVKTLYQMKSVGLEPKESLIRRVRMACGTRSLERRIC